MTRSAPQIDVVLSSDTAYIPHLATAVTSLLRTNKDLVRGVWVITDAGHSKRFKRFASHINLMFGIQPISLDVDPSRFGGLFISGHVTWATYARFLLGELLPADLDRALYLDADLIVVGPLDELVERVSDLGGVEGPVVAAVARDSGEHLREYEFQSDKYFNAGVLLVNLEAWRARGIQEKSFKRATELFGHLHLWDQDVLNLVLEDEWFELPGKFNETIVEGINPDSRIIHFVGATKPWMFGASHPFRVDYLRHRSATPFRLYFYAGLGKYLRRWLPRPLQRPVRSLRRLARRMRRGVGAILGR